MIGERRRREKQGRPGRAGTAPAPSRSEEGSAGPREQVGTEVGTAPGPGTPTPGARSPQPRAVPQGKASARKTNGASRATGAPASRAAARYREPVPGREGRPLRRPLRPGGRGAAPGAGGRSGSPAAGGSGARGPEAGRGGAQGLAATFDSQPRRGPSHLRPQVHYRPSSPGLF